MCDGTGSFLFFFLHLIDILLSLVVVFFCLCLRQIWSAFLLLENAFE